MQLLPHRNMQQEVRGHLQSFGWHESTCSFYQASQSVTTCIHSPSTMVDSQDCQKTGSRLVGWWRRLQKHSMGTGGEGRAANGKLTQCIFCPELSSHDHALTHGTLCTRSQVIKTTGLRNDYTLHSGASSPRNSTWFTRPFSLWKVWSGHKTSVWSTLIACL